MSTKNNKCIYKSLCNYCKDEINNMCIDETYKLFCCCFCKNEHYINCNETLDFNKPNDMGCLISEIKEDLNGYFKNNVDIWYLMTRVEFP